MKATKRALLTSVTALMLCFAMLLGTTYAWFTDSVTSAGNVITSGTLDLEVEYTLDGENWANLENANDLFQKGPWEPGHTEVIALHVKNNGTLALKYIANMNIVKEEKGININGEEFALSEILTVSTLMNASQEAIVDAFADENGVTYGAPVSFKASNLLSGEKQLLKGEEAYFIVKVDMAGTVGNEANAQVGKEPSIEFGINFLATQVTYESDSFGDTYDQGAKLTLSSYADLSAVKGQNGTYTLAEDMAAENIIHFGNGTIAELNLNGKTITAGNPGQFILGAQQGSKLVLNGEGTVNCGKGFMTNKGGAEIEVNAGTYNSTVTQTLSGTQFAHLAQNNSKIVINGGTFTTNVDNAALFFATSNARIEIRGGFFENTVDKTPDLLGIGTNKGNTNRIVITGGTFVNYNPLEDQMCYTGAWPANGEAAFGGPWILIPGDYTVVAEAQANGDIWYSVVPV